MPMPLQDKGFSTVVIHPAHPTHQGNLVVWWHTDPTSALDALHPGPADGRSGHLNLAPASLAPNDPMLGEIRRGLRSRLVPFRIVVPRAPARAVLSGLPGGASGWIRTRAGERVIRIDRRILDSPLIGIVPITARHYRGPFALDLASHFLHPIDRARLVVARDRARQVAEVAANVAFSHWLIGAAVGYEILWLTTGDAITAELWSLALAERFLDQAAEMQGPWEDPTIQRATELDLGVKIPSEIRIAVRANGEMPREVSDLIVTGCRRLGVAVPTALS